VTEQEKKQKEKLRDRYAFAYYKVKQYLRKAIERNRLFLEQQKLDENGHTLTGVQTMAYQATLEFCEKMENDYEKNGTQNL
jgi:hypothetical protein